MIEKSYIELFKQVLDACKPFILENYECDKDICLGQEYLSHIASLKDSYYTQFDKEVIDIRDMDVGYVSIFIRMALDNELVDSPQELEAFLKDLEA